MLSPKAYRNKTIIFKCSGLIVPYLRVYGAWIVSVDFLYYDNDEVMKMDMKRKKELLYEWKNRHPEMGVISIRCKITGDTRIFPRD